MIGQRNGCNNVPFSVPNERNGAHAGAAEKPRAPGQGSFHPCAETGQERYLPCHPSEKSKDRFECESEQDVGDQVETSGHRPGQPFVTGEQDASRDPASDRDKEEHQYGKHGEY